MRVYFCHATAPGWHTELMAAASQGLAVGSAACGQWRLEVLAPGGKGNSGLLPGTPGACKLRVIGVCAVSEF